MDAINERQQLCRLIQQWNENRLDLFSLTQPDEVCYLRLAMEISPCFPATKNT